MDRRSEWSVNIYAGVDDVRKEDAAVTIACQRPVDLVRRDRTREIEMIIRGDRPWNRIQRRTPTGDGRRAGRGETETKRLKRRFGSRRFCLRLGAGFCQTSDHWREALATVVDRPGTVGAHFGVADRP